MRCVGWLEAWLFRCALECQCRGSPRQPDSQWQIPHQRHPGHLAKASFPAGTGSLALCRMPTSNGSGSLACRRVPQLLHPRGICLSEAGRHSPMRRFLSEACPVWHLRGITTTAGSYNTWPHSSRQCLGGPQMRQDPHHSEVDEELIPTAIVIKNACAHRQPLRAQRFRSARGAGVDAHRLRGNGILFIGWRVCAMGREQYLNNNCKSTKGCGQGMMKAPFALSCRSATFHWSSLRMLVSLVIAPRKAPLPPQKPRKRTSPSQSLRCQRTPTPTKASSTKFPVKSVNGPRASAL
jgi:hypothetical protein